MNKKTTIYLVFGILFSIILIPMFINGLMFKKNFLDIAVAGDKKTWISSLASLWGAIIGGVISGVITLIGVRMTIQESAKGIDNTLKEQKKIRDEDLKMATTKERLSNLYHPVQAMCDEFQYKYGAHAYMDLTPFEQEKLNTTVNQNIIYAESKLYYKYMELRWAMKNEDWDEANKLYDRIRDIISDDVETLRIELNLPEIKLPWEIDDK